MKSSTLRPLGSSVYRLSSVNDNSETSVAKVSNMIDPPRPPPPANRHSESVRWWTSGHWIFGSIYGFRWMLY
jgi:hypothetical protein